MEERTGVRTEEEAMSVMLEDIGRQILTVTRSELYLSMRFLDVALSSFQFVMDPQMETIGTDGLAIYYEPSWLGGRYREDRTQVNRVYLHMVLHAIFRHITGRKGRDKRYYDLACDIAAESVIDGLPDRCVRGLKSFPRRETYRRLKEKMKVLTAEKICRELMGWELSPEAFARLEEEFRVDSHLYWPEDDPEKRQQVENQWQDISEKTQMDMEAFSSEASSQAGTLVDQLRVENRQRYDYGKFLRKFAVLKEEMAVDPDSFDYVFYSYGLRLYGNLPLIEPQEWKEEKKIQEFAVIIDTSMSCSGELVRRFLEETYTVLSEENSFFRKVNIHIIQCDEAVQTDVKITRAEELVQYMEQLELMGEGGTDFRPAFAYVDRLRAEHAFDNLRGVLYFTDGKGIFPEKMPPYETAFVFLEEDYEEVEVPPWAIKLILSEEDLLEEGRGGTYAY